MYPGTPCSNLVDKILDLHHKIEAIWDEKNFLDRNQHKGRAKPQQERSKLKSKMGNPKASIALESKWEIELVQVEAVIEKTEMKRAVL